MDFISDQVQAYPELAERYSRLGELFERKSVPCRPALPLHAHFYEPALACV